MKITAHMLKKNRACSSQLRKFIKLFPNGVVVTKKLCLLYTTDFNFEWAAENFFNKDQLAEYKKIQGPALAEYVKIKGPAFAEYLKIQGQAFAEYVKIKGPAFAEYEKIKGPAFAEYEKIQGPALAEYKKQTALAFYTASRVK